MGGSYSDLNVYLRSKKHNHITTDYTVTFTKKNFDGCCSFVVFTYEINFTPTSNGQNYNVLLYDGYNSTYKGRYVFGYYYPRNENEVIQHVSAYYSVLAPNHPLVISFKNKTNTYNCYLDRLKNGRWDRGYNISGYSFGNPLSKDVLDEEFKKLQFNKKIKFTTGGDITDIAAEKQEIKLKNFRFIFIPKGNESVLGVNCLFSLDFKKNEPKLTDSQETNKNQIDPYFLTSVNGQYYDGIIVYFERDQPRTKPKPISNPEQKDYKGKVLFVEFIDSSKEKTYLKRKDEDGYWWDEEKIDCNGDIQLLQELGKIKSELKSSVVTVILDEKKQYKGSTGVPSEDHKVYMKYTHKFGDCKKTVLLFERKKLEVGPFKETEKKAKHVEVYYLKAGGNEDSQPFLIVFDQKGDDKDDKKEAYHFTNTDKFDDWKEFQFKEQEKPLDGNKLIKKLYEKVGKIGTNGSCIDDLPTLRWYANKILIDPETGPAPVPPTTKPERPPEEKPPDKDEGLPIPWIIGGSVGGGVFVVSSAVGYGVYWYNTTIKLLT
ncbi:hypothetical protein MACJ_002413 [Theileria orientalis]|uniref:Uncharacterized protein n=1 Tax=Theileria orientalis TaxID=68886 RepID=A0A976QQJ4_THEOR|nr:hypothetical protein MACJ_002413 [Theileria orientalis]